MKRPYGLVLVDTDVYGIWHYPVILTATKPVPDDVMTLQAHHLTGEVMKGFRLTSLIIHAIGSPLLCTHKSM